MPSTDGEGPRDRELTLKHQYSFSDSGRSSIPMWDSSDPDRAPPPLPLNPTSPSRPAVKPNTSATVAAAAAALTEKARQSSPTIGAYTVNEMGSKREPSPEKSLLRGHHHRRLQSLHSGTGSVREFSNYLEGHRSREVSPEKPSGYDRDFDISSPEKSPTRSGTPTPKRSDSGRDTPVLRPTARLPPKSILGENESPQSATMLALQTMPTPNMSEASLSNITNSSSPVRSSQTWDAISTQILSLTSICTSLQREMAQLSRRSKDNATDLMSLKDATNARDEDIRKSLKELVENLSSKILGGASNDLPRFLGHHEDGTRSMFLDNKPFGTPPSGAKKSFSLPRIPSPNSFSASLERELAVSPNPFSVDGAAHLALLEKVLREMATKEGQANMTATLATVLEKIGKDDTSGKKVEEILDYLKDNLGSRALVKHIGNSQSDPVLVAKAPGEGFVSEDILQMLRKVKDSASQSGGLTAEVKALVRELRGEVLGMGRELGRKLEQVASSPSSRDMPQGSSKEEVENIIQAGLAELRDHMEALIKERRRQSSSSSISRNTVDSQEVYDAVKNALSDLPLEQIAQAQNSGLQKEDILETIREAWESYKPEIELQNFGLEREEILQCLKEGLEEYSPRGQLKTVGGLSREDVMEAVNEGLQNFPLPAPIDTASSISREEMLMAFRECMETFDFSTLQQPTPQVVEITKDDVYDAVREGLSSFEQPRSVPESSRELAINRDDLFEAVREGLHGSPAANHGVGEQVLIQLQEIGEGMRTEFQQYSAANGRDTEQVLDALKDGLESLRGEIETYVDRAADVTGKDEIIEIIRDGFDQMREDVDRRSVQGQDNAGTAEVLDGLREEMEHMRGVIATTIVKSNSSADKDEIMDVLRENMDELRSHFDRQRDRPESILSNTGEILDGLSDGLDALRSDIEKMINRPIDNTVHYEILDTLKDGLAAVRADIDSLQGARSESKGLTTASGQIVIADPTTGEEAQVPNVNPLKREDIDNLEIMLTQLRIKVEALETMPQTQPAEMPIPEGIVLKDDLIEIQQALQGLEEAVAGVSANAGNVNPNENAASKEDTDAIETLLRNMKANLDEMAFPDPEMTARKEDVEAVETLLRNTKATVDDIAARQESSGSDSLTREDLAALESMMKELRETVEELRAESKKNEDDLEKVTKTDVEAVEAVCLDTKAAIEQMVLPDLETMPTKADVEELSELVKDFTGKVAMETEKANDERKVESEDLVERVSEVRTYLEELKEELKSKLEDGGHTIDSFGTMLGGIEEMMKSQPDVSAEVKEVIQSVIRESERIHANMEETKSDQEIKTSEILTKQAELAQRVDDGFDELMTKYEDAQQASEERARAAEMAEARKDEVLAATRAAMDELRTLMDTFGATVTESSDKMEADSKTVFNRVNDTYNKVDEIHLDSRHDHEQTREEVTRAVTALSSLQGEVSEHHPKVLSSLDSVMALVREHFDHAQQWQSEEKERSINFQPPPPEPMPMIEDLPGKYDDISGKLDQLMGHVSANGESMAKMALLDAIHEQVMTTAVEVSNFVTSQAKLIADDHEDKERQAEEAAIALEKRLAQKELVEAETVALREEKEELKTAVEAMKAEKEQLSAHKTRLTADVSSLEMALKLRREELAIMESRALSLERKILDGIMDHSRAFLISKKPTAKDINRSLSLKRVPSRTASVTSSQTTSTVRGSNSVTSSAISMNLKRRPNSRVNSPANAERRILSLSQMGGNSSPRPDSIMDTSSKDSMGLKRSHSVKAVSAGYGRKTSWGGRSAKERASLSVSGNKENEGLRELSEEEEPGDDEEDHGSEYTMTTGYDDEDDAATTTSRDASSMVSTVGGGTLSSLNYDHDHDDGASGHSESEAESRLSYGTTVQTPTMIDDATEGSVHYDGEGTLLTAEGHDDHAANERKVVLFGQPSDSGLGAEPGTASLVAGGSDYFQGK